MNTEIRLLPDGVVNQIAAGEVVERPASVVKELVENALDAGATRVEILLKAGGKERIRVSDDGSGMSRENAMMCLERHATSKIRATADLDGVRSLGFRGEAIPSIASVSRMEIQTCVHGADEGVRILVHGGDLVSIKTAGCPAGTRFDIKSLFFNIPARRKFLRTDTTELAHCVEAVVRQALGRPEVAFRLQHDGKVIFTSEAGDLGSRMRDVLGKDAMRLRDVSIKDPSVRGHGYISALSVRRPSHKALYAYVNGRFVRDPLLRRAIADAYRDRVDKGRHPLVLLVLELPDGEVDVNVHPAKTEVRFRRPREVQGAITQGLRAALVPPQSLPPAKAQKIPTLPLPMISPHPDDDPLLELRVQPVAPVVSAPYIAPVELPPIQAIPAAELLAEDGESTRSLRPIGPFGRRWILCEGDDALIIIDHVRADDQLAERRLLRDAGAQRLLVPNRQRVSQKEADQLEASAETLSALGIEIARLSPTEVAIRTVPAVLQRLHLDGLLKKLAASPTAATLAASRTLPDPPDARQLRAMLASLEEAGLDAVVRRIPTQELLRAGQ